MQGQIRVRSCASVISRTSHRQLIDRFPDMLSVEPLPSAPGVILGLRPGCPHFLPHAINMLASNLRNFCRCPLVELMRYHVCHELAPPPLRPPGCRKATPSFSIWWAILISSPEFCSLIRSLRFRRDSYNDVQPRRYNFTKEVISLDLNEILERDSGR